MRGYNTNRTTKPMNRNTSNKVLTIWNGKAYTRVSAKSIEFYKKEVGVTREERVNEHRIEYYNNNNFCVMIYEF